jgi:hypothetical protein
VGQSFIDFSINYFMTGQVVANYSSCTAKLAHNPISKWVLDYTLFILCQLS